MDGTHAFLLMATPLPSLLFSLSFFCSRYGCLFQLKIIRQLKAWYSFSMEIARKMSVLCERTISLRGMTRDMLCLLKNFHFCRSWMILQSPSSCRQKPVLERLGECCNSYFWIFLVFYFLFSSCQLSWGEALPSCQRACLPQGGFRIRILAAWDGSSLSNSDEDKQRCRLVFPVSILDYVIQHIKVPVQNRVRFYIGTIYIIINY